MEGSVIIMTVAILAENIRPFLSWLSRGAGTGHGPRMTVARRELQQSLYSVEPGQSSRGRKAGQVPFPTTIVT
jgi:hypothetical protein